MPLPHAATVWLLSILLSCCFCSNFKSIKSSRERGHHRTGGNPTLFASSFPRWKGAGEGGFAPDVLMHRIQPFVEVIRREIDAVFPGDGREPVIEHEIREPLAVAQRFEFVAVELVGEIDYAFATVVELQPHLVIT